MVSATRRAFLKAAPLALCVPPFNLPALIEEGASRVIHLPPGYQHDDRLDGDRSNDPLAQNGYVGATFFVDGKQYSRLWSYPPHTPPEEVRATAKRLAKALNVAWRA